MDFYEQKEAAATEELEWQVQQQTERKAAKAFLCSVCALNGTRCRDGVWCPSRRQMDGQCEDCPYWVACLDPDWCPAQSE